MTQHKTYVPVGFANKMPDISSKKIVMGFWHNWPEGEWNGSGYRQGYFRNLALTDIPQQYNVIAVAFMKVQHGSDDHIPTFKPYSGTDADFRRQVDQLNKQGRAVLISLGGADAHIALSMSDERALVDRIIYLVETYGFDGLDIDLEQAAITAKENQLVIPSALKKVKEYYSREGKNFIISMAPEFPYLRDGNSYVPYITSLEGYYDFVAPQFYNQGADGVWVQEVGGNLTQNNDAVKEDFLYYLTESIVTGSRGYTKIPHEKFVIGLPSNNDAANNGYVIDSNAVKQALIRLDKAQIPIKGVMTWSINWDAGRTKNGEEYNWEFINRYGYISGEHPPISEPEPQKPNVPSNFNSTEQTSSSITLNWQPSLSATPIKEYILYRDNAFINAVTAPPFIDIGLKPNLTYRYQISAVDILGNSSTLSEALNVTTKSSASDNAPKWDSDIWYADNTRVTYQDCTYVCVMQHTSNKFWAPLKATALWDRS